MRPLLSKSFPFLRFSFCSSAKPKSNQRSQPISMASFSTFFSSGKPQLRGVVFDMDGTLTVPVIDFPAMYKAVLGHEEYAKARAQSPSGIDILHLIEKWTPERQTKAYEVITEFERQGLDRLQIMPGAMELYKHLESLNMRKGLITRNVKAAVDIFHQRFGMSFSPALSREFRPCKPHPAPLHHICSTWGIKPNEVIMVGDSLRDDVACGKQAGAYTCLLDGNGHYSSHDFEQLDLKPDFKISSLSEICSLMDRHFELVPCH